MTANHGALEHKQGFFAVFNGAGQLRCGSHPRRMGEAVRSRRSRHRLQAPSVLRLDASGRRRHAASARRACAHARARRADRILDASAPARSTPTGPIRKSGLDGKFSVQYVLARALMHGIVSLEHFSDAAVRDAGGARADGQGECARPIRQSRRSDTTIISMRGCGSRPRRARRIEHFVDRPLGRDRDHPLPAGTLEAKFRDCARRALDEASTEEVLRLCSTLDELADAGDVLTAMTHTRSVEPLDAQAGLRVMLYLVMNSIELSQATSRRARRRRRQCGALRRHLGARERRARADAGSRSVRGARRQFALHRRRLPLRLSRRRGPDHGAAVARQRGSLERRFRHLHRRAVLRRHVRGDRISHRLRSCARSWSATASKTATWVAQQGVKLQPGLGRQAYKVDGKFKFWGGLALHIWGGGPEMLKALYANVERRGIPIVYETPAVSLIRERGRVAGVVAEASAASRSRSGPARSCSPAAASSPIRRCARAISGPNWELAKIRGTRFNMGAGLTHGARRRARGPTATGRAAIRSPGTSTRRPTATSRSATSSRSTIIRSAFSSTPRASATSTRAQTSTATLMRNMAARSCASPACSPGRCSTPRRRRSCAANIASAASPRRRPIRLKSSRQSSTASMREAFLRTVRDYNAACRSDVPFNPNVLDGRSTQGLAIDKTNWAVPLDTPPFHAYHVTTGVTFTFGGVKISQTGRGRESLRPRHSGALCGGRDGRRAFLSQLLQRHRPDVGRNLRPARRAQRGAVGGESVTWSRAHTLVRARAWPVQPRIKPPIRAVADLATERLAAYAAGGDVRGFSAGRRSSAPSIAWSMQSRARSSAAVSLVHDGAGRGARDRRRWAVPPARRSRQDAACAAGRARHSAPSRTLSNSTICASPAPACMRARRWRCRRSPWRRR